MGGTSSAGNSYASWSELRALRFNSTTEDDLSDEANTSSTFATNKIDFDFRVVNESGKLVEMVLPDEMLEQILSYCDVKDVLNTNQVCRRWKTMTCSVSFWRALFKRRNIDFGLIPNYVIEKENCWIALYAIAKENLLTKNLVRNPSGADQFLHWDVIDNGGNGMAIEDPPVGCDALPESPFFNETSCFVTSYQLGTFTQTINLTDIGLTQEVQSQLKPFKLCFTVMAGARFDCRVMGSIKMQVTNRTGHISMGLNAKITALAGSNWKEVKLELFVNEGETAEVVVIGLSGSDSQFWAGHYGIKFARACLKIELSQIRDVVIMNGIHINGISDDGYLVTYDLDEWPWGRR